VDADLAALAYLASGILFVLALRGLSSPETSRRGNLFGMSGMAIAIGTSLLLLGRYDALTWALILGGLGIGGTVGALIARRIAMTAMPQLVAAFHSLVGLAALLVAGSALYTPQAFGLGPPGSIKMASLIEMSLGGAIGAITFSGSLIAFGKLHGLLSGAPVVFRGQHALNALLGLSLLGIVIMFCISESHAGFWGLAALALVLGVTLIIPIGGADMPVVVSMLNSYSGWAAAGIGFTLENSALIITGALVGSSGAILSHIMCKGMNRSFISVILGGFGAANEAPVSGEIEQRPVRRGSAEDAAFILRNAGSVIIVPGYGMAVAQAQHALREMAEILKRDGVKVSYAIHPVAGRMPGHMNVLLAEANVSYDDVYELEDINSQFPVADVAFVIGANDVTNPAAKTDRSSAIYGMPILDVEKARTVLFIKRGMGAGYAGVENELFFRGNTMMLFADARKMVEDIVKALGR
jgi:H+-translocating NAD(P) transhydrogenase subunit beta